MRLSPTLLLASALAWLAVAGCQSEPPVDANEAPVALERDLVEVPDSGQVSVRADVAIPLGRVTVGRAERGTLFQAETALPAGGARPILRTETVDAESGPRATVRLSLNGETASVEDLRTLGDDVAWRLLFARRVPTDLSLDLGLAGADLDLTGVPLSRLAVNAGAGRTRLVFTAANPVAMRELTIRAGVRSFTGEGLGWARFERLSFEGGVGRFAVDLSGGALAPGARATLRVGVASLEVTLPRGHPTVIEVTGAPGLSISPPEGFVVAGEGRYASPGADGNAEALTVRVEAGPGRVRFRVR